MRFNKLQLINSPLDLDFIPGIRAGTYPPLHLASLTAYITEYLPDFDINVIDGEFLSVNKINSRIDADLIGISCNSLSYGSALDIAKYAKNKGAFVVLGGTHPTIKGSEIIKNIPYVDAVIYGDGELPLLKILTNKSFSKIPNLIYRDGKKLRINKESNLSLDLLPWPKYENIEISSYFQKYQELYPYKPFKKAFAVYSAKGCRWRTSPSGGCIYCGVQHSDFRLKSFHKFIAELMNIHSRYGADFFWDVSDSFTMQKKWVFEFANIMPVHKKFRMQVYSRASDIDEDMVKALKKIGVYEVFLGLESGSNRLLKEANKGFTLKSNVQAVNYLAAANIKSVIAIVLGLPGESEETLEMTYKMVSELFEYGNITEINANLMLPLPGSQIYKKLINFFSINPKNQDFFDGKEIRRLYVERFCKVSYERLIEEQNKYMFICDRVGTFGQTN